MSTPFTFLLPAELSAKEPPERRGIARDGVRLMTINRNSGEVDHSRFNGISEFLRPGDLLIFNTSRTLPASLQGCDCTLDKYLEIRLAQHLPDDSWLALLMCQQGNPFACGLQEGMNLDFGEGLTAKVENQDIHIPRLWKISFSLAGTQLMDSIYRLGNPIRYEYVSKPWDLDYYQTVYAKEPGSAEMPSAGRAFTWKLLFDLKRKGIETAQIVLHTGLSSYMDDELDALHPASEEEYFISETAAKKINRVRQEGGRIIAVGTTVVRALESAVDIEGLIKPQHSYTRLHISAEHQLKIVDGLLTGMHEPEASHLDLLTAFLSAEQIQVAYEDAVQRGYLWHEFGDLNLIL
ncbi:S-adenosylmethionine:tRNA-ribosyltransferase-isomerase (queuine synthetase) [Rivularia sp. PCC 7116]|uniref:S-adenosylmethionine:tRNA ribosyltransferase-isomerase n=1 Tax=Rivularia sp. PCC 7116 TaxID=373994 RepID=UPI00029EF1C1|nr:S-adenosylmethionine:tRNA ribosyltransferase-isomerase [Rivularia sp. PCC 7116]AFY56738.1 S-adenosylmethionine:tRNA-ribosyltransferase-isomerase (queuine synthetase) [Rivularia sp. PCC 7116]